MKIKSWKAAAAREIDGDGIVDAVVGDAPIGDDIAVRIVRESDWRRIMAVVRAADNHACPGKCGDKLCSVTEALRKHLEKRK